MSAAPTIPARPQRSQATAAPAATNPDTPTIPPRPVRKIDPSPEREAYTRSPLNALPGSQGGFARPPLESNKLDPSGTVRRPQSINLPSEVGQEGFEYTSYDQLPSEAHGVAADGNTAVADPEQTRNVSADIPLHAPTASVPLSTATSRIATVTRTDSAQAAAAGIGLAPPDDDAQRNPAHPSPLSRVTSRTNEQSPKRPSSTEPHQVLRARSSFNASTPSLHNSSKPPSILGEGHEGIPEIGMQIPLYRNAGDVQAPAHSQVQSQHTPGIGFFNDGSSRAHHRKKSSRHDFGTQDIYGLHSHNREPQDQFERDWLAKHPKEAAAEGYNVYLPRPETALSTEQLNKLVHTPENGFGTNRDMMSTPTQDIAFEASDLYAARISSPKPPPLNTGSPKQRPSSGTQPAVESPLRRTSFPVNDLYSESALENNGENVYHIDPTETKRGNKITGGGEADNGVDLGPNGGNTAEKGGWIDERGEGTPILASDEIIKRPGSAFQQPAVNPEMHHDEYYDSDYHSDSRRSSVRPPSRPSSRPGKDQGGSGYHGGSLHRFVSHEEQHASGKGTPLAEIEEYEPLFPDDEEEKPKAAAKIRPRLEEHHFPSQDTWEDTPSSLQYQATVETPEPPPLDDEVPTRSSKAVFETPDQEQNRRNVNPADMSSDSKTFIKPQFKKDVQDALHQRPGIQRFPSQDVWEDTPSSAMFETTVSGPQMDEDLSLPEERPTTTAIPGSQDDGSARSTSAGGFSAPIKPHIPARPERKSKLAQEITADDETAPLQRQISPTKTQPPTIPDRPKPQIPARPVKISQGPAEGSPLSKELSTSPPKSKPAVPARPAGNKFASLKAGFMNDLNSRLQLGPQGPPPKAKEPEAEPVEETPLVDARKGRARGPPRRSKAPTADASAGALDFAMPTTVWHIDEHDALNVPSVTAAQVIEAAGTKPSAKVQEEQPSEPVNPAQMNKILAENETLNTKSPAPVLEDSKVSPTAAIPDLDSAPAAPTERETLSSVPAAAIGAEGDVPEPTLAPETVRAQEPIVKGLEAAVRDSETGLHDPEDVAESVAAAVPAHESAAATETEHA